MVFPSPTDDTQHPIPLQTEPIQPTTPSTTEDTQPPIPSQTTASEPTINPNIRSTATVDPTTASEPTINPNTWSTSTVNPTTCIQNQLITIYDVWICVSYVE